MGEGHRPGKGCEVTVTVCPAARRPRRWPPPRSANPRRATWGSVRCNRRRRWCERARPSPSVPSTMASFDSAASCGSSMDTERSLRAMAAVLKPRAWSCSIPVCGQSAAVSPMLRPGHLKHRAHAHPHRPAAQRVAAGGVDAGRRPYSAPPRCGRWPRCWWSPRCPPERQPGGHSGAERFHRAGSVGRRKAHSTPRVSGDSPVRCGQHFPVGGVNGRIAAAGQRSLPPGRSICLPLHQQRERLIARVQRPGDDLGALGNEDALLRLQTAAQLVPGSAGRRGRAPGRESP